MSDDDPGADPPTPVVAAAEADAEPGAGDGEGDGEGDGGGDRPGDGAAGVGGRVRAWAQGAVQTLTVPILALFSALVVGGLVIIFSNPDALDEWGSFTADPIGALTTSWDVVYETYHALYQSSLGTSAALGRTLVEATPLALAGLSVALAFRAGLFNIGAAGQIVAGATASVWVGFTFDLPAAVHITLAVVVGAVAGAAWGGIAGVLKAATGAHEVITTIMLNYVSYQLLSYALRSDRFQRPGRDDPISKPVAESAQLPEVGLGDLRVHIGLFLALGAAWGTWWLLTRSTTGFRLRSVGANPFASRYSGMSVGGTYVLAMGLAGGLAGLAGGVRLLGVPNYSLSGSSSLAAIGFDAIAVALLGRANPIGVLGAAFLFGMLRAGSGGMQAASSTPVDIIVVLQALIIVFVAAPALVRAIYRVRAGRGTAQDFTTSWGGT